MQCEETETEKNDIVFFGFGFGFFSGFFGSRTEKTGKKTKKPKSEISVFSVFGFFGFFLTLVNCLGVVKPNTGFQQVILTYVDLYHL